MDDIYGVEIVDMVHNSYPSREQIESARRLFYNYNYEYDYDYDNENVQVKDWFKNGF